MVCDVVQDDDQLCHGTLVIQLRWEAQRHMLETGSAMYSGKVSTGRTMN